jgi:DNA-binding winged helix-turn-helix (wHTH) protein/tetratricopeptide (TPR) repeat protein
MGPMATETVARELTGYRFGLFEVRARTRILLRNGHPVRIQKFPVEVLLALLEDPGTVISREDLKSRLWGEQTYVQFDNGLQVAVAKLREALGDTAAKSNFVSTVPGEGYCFVGNVETVYSESPVPLLEPVFALEPAAVAQATTSGGKFPVAILCLLIIAAAVAGWFVFHRYGGGPPLSAADEVVIGEFTNATGKPELDGVFTTAFRVKLQESPYFRLVNGARQEKSAGGSVPVSGEAQLHACRERGGQVLVTGQLADRRPGYEVSVAARECGNGRQLASQTGYADSMASILPALGGVVESLRRGLGEPADKLGRFNASIEEATTNSPAAMKAFSLGDAKRAEGLTPEAIADYKLAVTLDPQFALAYARLGSIYSNMGDGTLGDRYYTTAFQLRTRVTDREGLYIAGHYFSDVTGELQQGIETYQLWRSLYPYDFAPANNLALQYLRAGQPDAALAPATDAVRLNPSDGLSQTTLAQVYLALGDYAKLNGLCKHEDLDAKGTLLLHCTCFRSSFAQSDEVGMRRELDWAKGRRAEAILLDEQAWVVVYQGKLREARHLFLDAALLAEKVMGQDAAAQIYLDAALMEADLGSTAFAGPDARKALELDPSGAMTQGAAALVFARSGDSAKAQTQSTEAARLAPLNTILNSVVLASASASARLRNQDSDQAIRVLESARPYDFNMTIPFASTYYRGLAYEANKQPQNAIL